MQGLDLIVKRGALSEAELVPFDLPDTPEEGTAVLRIDRFALTANTITYAVAPDLMRYWEFFPVEREGWGRAAFLERAGAAWAQFLDTGAQWINVVEDTGPEAALARYTAMLGGDVDPAEGLILSLQPG